MTTSSHLVSKLGARVAGMGRGWPHAYPEQRSRLARAPGGRTAESLPPGQGWRIGTKRWQPGLGHGVCVCVVVGEPVGGRVQCLNLARGISRLGGAAKRLQSTHVRVVLSRKWGM